MKDHSFRLGSPGRRAAAYWFIDGVPDIISGATLATLGAAGLWLWRQPLPSFERAFFLLLMLLLLVILFGGDRRIAEYLKARMTYPRTGYVRPPLPAEEARRSETVLSLGLGPQPPPDENVTAYRVHTVVVLLLGRVAFNLINRSWGLPVAMSAVAVAIYLLNRNSERPYHWWSVLLLPAAGLALMTLQLTIALEQWLVLVIGGVWLCAQGVWTLFWYLRRNPLPSAMKGIHA